MKYRDVRTMLADSFRQLAETTPNDRITIRDIALNCGYSQATFYRHFKDKYDLMVWDYARSVSRLAEEADGRSYRSCIAAGVKAFFAKREYLSEILSRESAADAFVRYMTQVHADLMRRAIMRNAPADHLAPEIEMHISLYCRGSTGLVCEWITGRHDVTAEALTDVIVDALPRLLRDILERSEA